jgi:hypothetical protein
VLIPLQRYSDTFDCTASWGAHSGIVLSSIVTRGTDPAEFELITGGNDGAINVISSAYTAIPKISLTLYAQVWKIHPATVDPTNDAPYGIVDADDHSAGSGA